MGADIWIMNKKAALGIIMGITIILVSVLIIYGITAQFFRSVDTGLQDAICRANVVGLAQTKTGSSSGYANVIWKDVKSTAINPAQRKPLCTTKVWTIDLEDSKSEGESIAMTTLELGEMIESCWNTFGQGYVANTFGQTSGNWGGNWNPFTGDKSTYYFNCYRFKINSPKNGGYDAIGVGALQNALYYANIKGESLFNEKGEFVPEGTGKELSGKVVDVLLASSNSDDESVAQLQSEEFIKMFEEYKKDSSPDNTPYAGYVYWDGVGYLEFVREVSYKQVSDVVTVNNAAAGGVGGGVIGGTIGGIVGTFFFPGVGTYAGAIAGAKIGVVLGTIGNAITSSDKVVYPQLNEDGHLPTLEFDTWYDVRFYSSYTGDAPNGLVLNNIKIMPSGSEGGTQITPIIVG